MTRRLRESREKVSTSRTANLLVLCQILQADPHNQLMLLVNAMTCHLVQIGLLFMAANAVPCANGFMTLLHFCYLSGFPVLHGGICSASSFFPCGRGSVALYAGLARMSPTVISAPQRT